MFFGECVYRENASDDGYSMVYHEKALPNYDYFIPCHRKYSGHHNQRGIRVANDGKLRCNTIKYTVTYLHSDWL